MHRYADSDWSLQDVVKVFRMFYQAYEEEFGMSHPHLSNSSILKIIEAMPAMDDEYGGTELSVEDYKTLIPAYFRTEFEHCNYSMSHFMSGNIRLMKYFEELY